MPTEHRVITSAISVDLNNAIKKATKNVVHLIDIVIEELDTFAPPVREMLLHDEDVKSALAKLTGKTGRSTTTSEDLNKILDFCKEPKTGLQIEKEFGKSKGRAGINRLTEESHDGRKLEKSGERRGTKYQVVETK
jgi:hypothetical protein